jgi:hypothetical protein
MVKQWSTIGNNYGVLLKNSDESIGYNEFFSSESTEFGGQLRPQIIIQYINNSGLENYWTYHSQNIGRAGTAHINDFNGNLVYIHNDISLSGSKMPLTLNHVFNSNEKDRHAFGNEGVTSIYGLGWRLNLSQKIDSLVMEGTQWYAYTDEDGTKIYFYYDKSSGTYKQLAGTDLTFTKNSDGTYSIKDKDEGVLDFSTTGYLQKIRDKNNNTITLSYDGLVLKRITDGAGRVTTLETLSNGQLIAITDPSGRKIRFQYIGPNLYRITYPDDKYSTFRYDSSNRLIEVTNYDGYKITYNYYSQAPYRISKVTEFGTDGITGGSLNLTYGYNTTTFTDSRGRKEVYQFNDYGNTITVRDDEGGAEYYKYFSDNLANKLSLSSKLQKFTKNYLRNHNAEKKDSEWTVDYWDGSEGSGSFSTDT